MATIIYIRPSGSEIELSDSKAHKKFAKDNGFKKKKVDKPSPQIELGGDNA